MSESPEVQAARLAERLSSIQELLQENRLDTKELHGKVEKMVILLTDIDNRVRILETQIQEQSPMYEEFNRLKYEVGGAKRAMRWIWIALTGLVALGISLKGLISELINK